MHESAGLATRIGAAALLISLPVPWFGHSFGPISINCSLWNLSNALAIALIVFALLAMVQLNVGPGLTGPLWAIAGAGLAAYLCYRLFTPPKTETSELLDALSVGLKPRPGIYLAIAGAGTIAYGGWLQMRFEAAHEAGAKPHEQMLEVSAPLPSARYVAPQSSDPFAVAPGSVGDLPRVRQPRIVRPDPFAVPPPAPPRPAVRPAGPPVAKPPAAPPRPAVPPTAEQSQRRQPPAV